MARSFSIKRRRRGKPPPVTEEQLRELDETAQAAFEKWRAADESATYLKKDWDRARTAYQAALRRMQEQEK